LIKKVEFVSKEEVLIEKKRLLEREPFYEKRKTKGRIVFRFD